MARRHKYISRAEKREIGKPVNIWDAARSLREERLARGEEPQPLRSIIREPDFRRNWNVWRNRENSFLERVEAASYWGWWEQQPDGTWRYIA